MPMSHAVCATRWRSSIPSDRSPWASCRRAPSGCIALRRLACRPEERLILLGYDTIDYPVVFFGAIRAGIVVIPLKHLSQLEQYAYMLGDSAVGDRRGAALARAILPVLERLPQLRSVILLGATQADKIDVPACAVHRFEEVMEREPAVPYTAPTVSDEVAFWLYTSGSTGDPKASSTSIPA